MKTICPNLLTRSKFWVIKIRKEQRELKCKCERKMNSNFKIKSNTRLKMSWDKSSINIKVSRTLRAANGIISKIFLKSMKRYILLNNTAKHKVTRLLKTLLKLSLTLVFSFRSLSRDFNRKKFNCKKFLAKGLWLYHFCLNMNVKWPCSMRELKEILTTL